MYRGKRGVWPGTPPLHLIQPGDQTAQQLQTQHSWPRPTHPAPISGGREMGAGEWRSGHVGWSISTHTLQAPPFSRDSQGRAPALHVSQCVSPCVWRDSRGRSPAPHSPRSPAPSSSFVSLSRPGERFQGELCLGPRASQGPWGPQLTLNPPQVRLQPSLLLPAAPQSQSRTGGLGWRWRQSQESPGGCRIA